MQKLAELQKTLSDPYNGNRRLAEKACRRCNAMKRKDEDIVDIEGLAEAKKACNKHSKELKRRKRFAP